jgi:ABC-2 type transport system ATP-binding protein
MTTHYMDEAEQCDRIAVIDHGEIVALDTPAGLKDEVGGDLVTINTPDLEAAATELRARFGLEPVISDDTISFQVEGGEAFLPDFVRSFGRPIDAIGLRRPTLDDVFLHLTGREIRDAGSENRSAAPVGERKR